MQAKISFTSLEKAIGERALQLFDKLFTKRMLIRLIGVKLSHLISGSYQIDLFQNTEKEINLSRALDSIKLRYGENAIAKGYLLKGHKGSI